MSESEIAIVSYQKAHQEEHKIMFETTEPCDARWLLDNITNPPLSHIKIVVLEQFVAEYKFLAADNDDLSIDQYLKSVIDTILRSN